MCDNKFRNQVDAIAPYGLTPGASAGGLFRVTNGISVEALENVPARAFGRTCLASWTVPGSWESSMWTIHQRPSNSMNRNSSAPTSLAPTSPEPISPLHGARYGSGARPALIGLAAAGRPS
jgi:hypothetical protein